MTERLKRNCSELKTAVNSSMMHLILSPHRFAQSILIADCVLQISGRLVVNRPGIRNVTKSIGRFLTLRIAPILGLTVLSEGLGKSPDQHALGVLQNPPFDAIFSSDLQLFLNRFSTGSNEIRGSPDDGSPLDDRMIHAILKPFNIFILGPPIAITRSPRNGSLPSCGIPFSDGFPLSPSRGSSPLRHLAHRHLAR